MVKGVEHNDNVPYAERVQNSAVHMGGSGNNEGAMASALCEPITGVWGQSPQRSPGAELLVRGFASPT